MKTYSRKVASDIARQLVAGGVLPGDAQNGAVTEAAPPGLLIHQVGGVVESSAFDLNGGYGTGYTLSLHVAVDLPAFGILGWKLDPPWEDSQFHWLADPTEYLSREEMYEFPGCAGLKYPRDEVINHRKVLKRGHAVDGLLLGCSFESMPESYRHGETIDARLVLIDELNRGFSTQVQLWLDRSAKMKRKRAKKSTRPGLFEKRDGAKLELIQK